MFFFYSRR